MKVALAVVAASLSVISCGNSNSDPAAENTSSTSSATTTAPNIMFQAISGGWSNSTPCNTTSFDYVTGHLKCDGYTTWTGTFTGTSHYYFDGYVNLSNNDLWGKLDETFTGSGLGTSGTFHMSETMTITAATSAIYIIAVIDSGTNGYQQLGGWINFTGTSDSSGVGTGTYSGKGGSVKR